MDARRIALEAFALGLLFSMSVWQSIAEHALTSGVISLACGYWGRRIWTRTERRARPRPGIEGV